MKASDYKPGDIAEVLNVALARFQDNRQYVGKELSERENAQRELSAGQLRRLVGMRYRVLSVVDAGWVADQYPGCVYLDARIEHMDEADLMLPFVWAASPSQLMLYRRGS